MLLTPTENEKNLIISTNRNINLSFMIEYDLNIKTIIRIIKDLKATDFKEKLINKHIEYKDEYLYVFSTILELNNSIGESKTIPMYTKFNLLPNKVILVSFHEAKYKFKEIR